MKETIVTEPILNPVMKPLPLKNTPKWMPLVSVVVVLFLAVGTGYVMAKKGSTQGTTSSKSGITTANSVNTSTEAGVNDTAAFPDSAQGVLTEGGISGEGTHHLDRGMGPTKDVYLTSTVINLQNFVGKKVEVQGQTISGKKAGWLMDVGRVKVIQ